ncbi:hypothetical protein C0J52_25031 [Blattella germanica]|nr:hypothetical protein C0J52_25031 [Blattella germanica]
MILNMKLFGLNLKLFGLNLKLFGLNLKLFGLNLKLFGLNLKVFSLILKLKSFLVLKSYKEGRDHTQECGNWGNEENKQPSTEEKWASGEN